MSIRNNTFWNLFGAATPLLIGLVAIPYILRGLGVEKMGILTLIWALIGYSSVFDFGLGRALTHKIARTRALGDLNKSHATISRSGLALIALTGMVGSLFVVFVIESQGVGWLNLSAAVSEEVKTSIYIAAIGIPITTMTSGLRGILEGFEKFRAVNTYRFYLGLTNFIAPVMALLLFGPNLPAILVLLVAARLIVMVLHFTSVKQSIPDVFSSSALLGKRDSIEFLTFGSWMTLSNFISPLMVVADRFLISGIVGAGLVAYYTVPSEFLLKLLILPAALTTTLFPVFSRQADFGKKDAAGLYAMSLKIISISMGSIFICILLFSKQGLELWVGKDFAEKSFLTVVILGIGIFFNSLAQVPHTAIQAKGHVKLTALLHLGEFACYVPLVYVLTSKYEIAGAAAAWSIRAILDFLLLHICARSFRRA